MAPNLIYPTTTIGEQVLFSSRGPLRYSEPDGSHRLVVEVDKELTNYYFSLIPKYFSVNKPRYAPHITVVRPHKETVPDLTAWRRHDGEEVLFYYMNRLFADNLYVWLNVFAVRLEQVRAELGMSLNSQYTGPPSGFIKCFHCTVANFKDHY